MSIAAPPLRAELPRMLRVAGPLVAAELGWMAMGIVDTMMVGRMSNAALAIAAVSLGGVLFYAVALTGGGILLGLDTLVSQAYGAGDVRDCHKSWLNGLYLVAILTPLLMALNFAWMPALRAFGEDPQVVRETSGFLFAINWSTLPLLVYFATRRYLQAVDHVRPVMFALISANLVNWLGNWLFIYGHWGMPAYGVAGSGWSTCISRIYMALVLVGFAIYYDRKDLTGLRDIPFSIDWQRIRELLHLGGPAAGQLGLEIGVFSAATALIGKLGALPLAAHQIALITASTTYMVPLGISSAAAVRVGQEIGAGNPRGATRAGWTAIFLGAGFMTCAAVALFAFPHAIASIFSDDAGVTAAAVKLLFICALFQLFDGLQSVTTGALRGLGETRIPMWTGGIAYWLVGLPIGWWLAFPRGMGASGIWYGLCIGLMGVGTVLLAVWAKRTSITSVIPSEPRPARASRGTIP